MTMKKICTLLDQLNTLADKTGGIVTFASPNYGTVRIPNGPEIPLYGPTVKDWRARNARIIEDTVARWGGPDEENEA